MLVMMMARLLGFKQLLKRPSAHIAGTPWLLRVPPLLGRLFVGLNTARFAQTLNILASSGVPSAGRAYPQSASVISHPMRDAVSDAAKRVREGSGVGHALERSGWLLMT
jgi:general secretion pathway protein F